MKQGFGLGKGLGALIPKDLIKTEKNQQVALSDAGDSTGVGSVSFIEIDKIIRVNPVQPRQDFDEERLQELAKSIMVHGVITPITVRRHFDGFELISGERRLRASRIVGLTTIPAFVIEVNSNAEMLEIALIENVQREDLNPLETAYGYQRLIEECGLKQEDVAVRVGKDRSTVANMLRLLKLPPDAQAALRTRSISMGHARALLALSNEQRQLAVLREVMQHDLSVRRTEALVKDIELGRKELGKRGEINQAPTAKRKSPSSVGTHESNPTLADIESSLRHIFGTQVRLRMRSDDQGTMEIEFYSIEELERLLDMIATIQTTNA
ncbi:MAG: ParB/RepB/Spo0J family partition protein [Bradyrhizobiaceae bacterium]|nr:ParB/RepB/Spo0J family partition protein [Bradyrhizobiaceae bacterium]